MSATTTLAARAQALLDGLPAARTLEALWDRAVLDRFAHGRPIDPDAPALRAASAPARVWSEVAPWPAEAMQARLSALLDTGRLAIARADAAWLEQLEVSWQALPSGIESLVALRARGELGLGLGARGARAHGWDADDLEALLGEHLVPDASPGDRAWLALAGGDVLAARRALAELEARLAARRQAWASDPEAGLRQARAHPGAALGVETAALRALLARVSA